MRSNNYYTSAARQRRISRTTATDWLRSISVRQCCPSHVPKVPRGNLIGASACSALPKEYWSVSLFVDKTVRPFRRKSLFQLSTCAPTRSSWRLDRTRPRTSRRCSDPLLISAPYAGMPDYQWFLASPGIARNVKDLRAMKLVKGRCSSPPSCATQASSDLTVSLVNSV
jgi:hypothetical protein